MAGDPEQFVWFLRWMPFAIGHGLNPLLTDWIDYPAGVNLMWNTAVPLPALLVAPVTLAAGPVLAYNVLVTAGIALTAWTGELGASVFVRRRWTAIVAGLLTGFSPYMVAHALGHLNLVIAFLPGIALYLLHDLLVARRLQAWLAGGLLGLAAAAQLLTGEEIVAATLLVSVLGGALWLLGLRLERMFHVLHWRRTLVGLGSAAAVLFVLSAAPLAVQLLGPQRTLHATGAAIEGNDLAQFVAANSLQALPLFPLQLAQPFLSEQNAYLGLPLLLVLAAIGWRFRRLHVVRWLGLMALGVAILSLGPHLFAGGRRLPGVLPWRALTPIPVANDVLPNRLMLFVYLLVGVLLALALDRAFESGRARGLAVVAVVALALVPLVPSLAFPATREVTPPYFLTQIQREVPAGAVLLVTPLAQPDALLWQAQSGLWFRTPQGYARIPGCGGVDTDFTPASATSAALAAPAPPGPAEVAEVRQELAYWRVREVVVGPGSPPAAAQVFTAITGAPGRETGGVTVFSAAPQPPPGTPPSTLCRT